jgi:hypothetical protein
VKATVARVLYMADEYLGAQHAQHLADQVVAELARRGYL